MHKRNIKKIVAIGFCFLFVLIIPHISVNAEQPEALDISMHQQTELETQFIGRIRGGILPTVGYSINNIGNEIAQNITATYNIEGGFSG